MGPWPRLNQSESVSWMWSFESEILEQQNPHVRKERKERGERRKEKLFDNKTENNKKKG